LYSITSSAPVSRVGGTVRPSRLRSLAGYLAASASGIVDDFPGFIQGRADQNEDLDRWSVAPRGSVVGFAISKQKSKNGGNIMKRREFLKTAGAGLAVSTAVAAPAIAQSMPELKWRCTTSWPKSLDVPFSASETISKYVAEATDNKFQIQAFAGGEIVPCAAGGRCGEQRHGRDVSHRGLLLHRQGPRPSRCIAPFRSG